MSLPLPTLAGAYYEYEGTVPASAAAINTDGKTIRIVSLVLTNITANDIAAVTMATNESSPTTEATFFLPARDQVVFIYEAGWKFKSGIRISDATGSAVRVQIRGYKEY